MPRETRDMDKAMGVIAQQDEDIDTLLGNHRLPESCEHGFRGERNPCRERGLRGNDEKNCEPDTKNDSGRADSATDFRELLRVVASETDSTWMV